MKLVIFFLLSSCGYFFNAGKTANIQIINNSKYIIDSIQVSINNYQFTIKNVPERQASNYSFEKDSVIARHDVNYFFKGFIADSIIFDQWVPSNDLGHIPKNFKLRITDSLTAIAE